MRIGGLISDLVGELRLAEPEIFENEFFGSGRLVTWKGGRFAMGYPLGMPLGVDAGVAFQIYSAGALVGATTEPLAIVEVEDGLQWFEILGVATHLAGVAQTNVLDQSLGRRVTLAWPASASDDVAAYRVYHDSRAGAVDYDVVVGELDAKPGGLALDEYSWTSGELESGTWTFGVRAVDAAGNVVTSPAREAEALVASPPDPPSELACAYDADAHVAMLSWSAPERWS